MAGGFQSDFITQFMGEFHMNIRFIHMKSKKCDWLAISLATLKKKKKKKLLHHKI